MKTAVAMIGLFVVALPFSARADEPAHPMSQHPAVLVKRQQANAPYDYTAHFYPHPAWMYLETDRHEMGEHPAVIVARKAAQERAREEAARVALAKQAAARP